MQSFAANIFVLIHCYNCVYLNFKRFKLAAMCNFLNVPYILIPYSSKKNAYNRKTTIVSIYYLN